MNPAVHPGNRKNGTTASEAFGAWLSATVKESPPVSLRDYLYSLRKNWALIVALTLLGALAGYAYASLQPSVYRAQSEVIIIPARGDNTSELVQGSNYVQNLVQTYAVVAISPRVLGPVVEMLNLPDSPKSLAGMVSVDAPLDTQVLVISVLGEDRVKVAAIANEVATQLANAVESLSPQNADDQPAVRIETITPATAPTFPVEPNVRLLTIIGAIIGAIIAIGFAVLRATLATKLASHSDISAVTDLPILGDVYQTSGSRSLPATLRHDPTSAVAESVRSLAAGMRFANVDGKKKVFLFTSSNSGDGKSSVSVATALILAEQGNSVLLIDADLRRASIARLTGLEGAVGLTTILLDETTIDAALQPLSDGGADVLTSGALPPNPGQLLSSDRMKEVLNRVRDRYDYVIMDSPPVLAVSDPLWLAPMVDGIVVVVRARTTKRDSLKRTLLALEPSRTEVLGIVVNEVKRPQSDSYYETDARRETLRRDAKNARS